MNHATLRVLPLLLAASTVFLPAARSDTPPHTDSRPAPGPTVLAAARPAQPDAPAASPPTTASPSPEAPPEWGDLKDLGFDERVGLMAGLARLHAGFDQRIDELKTRRDALTTADAPPGKWDSELEILGTARTRLLSTSTDLGKATPDNWEQRKQRVSDAWTNAQNAFAKAAAEAPL